MMLAAGAIPAVHCCGDDTDIEVKELGAKTRKLPYAKGGHYGTPEFLDFIGRKFDVILEELERDDVLFLDTDVLMFGNPLDTIDTDCDIFAQDDWALNTSPRGPQICTGCWWIRSCDETKALLRAAQTHMAEKRGTTEYWCDESAINHLVGSSSVRVKFADRDAWQNGTRWEDSDKTGCPQLLHANGVGRFTVEDKLKFMGEALALLSPSDSLPRNPHAPAESAPISECERTAI
jgi:hypothetical protein